MAAGRVERVRKQFQSSVASLKGGLLFLCFTLFAGGVWCLAVAPLALPSEERFVMLLVRSATCFTFTPLVYFANRALTAFSELILRMHELTEQVARDTQTACRELTAGSLRR